jgi:hypothetical protein
MLIFGSKHLLMQRITTISSKIIISIPSVCLRKSKLLREKL